MKSAQPPPNVPAGRPNAATDDDDDEGGLDLQAIKDYGGFVLGAPRRHKWVVVLTIIAVVGVTRLLLWALPRTYHVESTLLAQLVHIDKIALQGNSLPDNAPTRLVQQTVLRRDNLIKLVEETQLTKTWDRSRPPIHRLKDQLMAKLGRAPSEADKFEALVAVLESRIYVSMIADWSGEGTVTFAVDWPDPEMAYRLCTATQQNFLESRHVSEIDSYSEGIAILRARAETVRNEIDTIALQIETAREEERAPTPAEQPTAEGPRRPRPASTEALPPPPDPGKVSEAAKLKASIDGKKTAVNDLEGVRSRRVLELQARLSELRATYADSHPLVMDTMRTINAMQQDSPQVAQLRAEIVEMRGRYRELTGRDVDDPVAGLSVPAPRRGGGSRQPRTPLDVAAAPEEGDDRAMEFLRAQLRMQMSTYDRLMERIDAVQMELDAAEAAFKYRYTVIRPAQMPNAPSKPNTTLISVVGYLAALVLALMAAVVADILDGRIIQRWQVERIVDLPVLGELRLKP